jgi:hypothetical protein
MSDHAGDENQPTCVRSAFTFAESPSDCSAEMFMRRLRMASIALRPSSPMLATAWCAQVGSSATSPSPPLPSPPRESRPALRAGAARSFIVLDAFSSEILARSALRSALRRCSWKCAAVCSPSSAAVCSAPSAGCQPSSSSPSSAASSHALAMASSDAMNLACCTTDVLSGISSMDMAIDSSLPVSLFRR